jgi:hypothetical protein
MTKRILPTVLVAAALGVSLSGCVPVFAPVSGPRESVDRTIDAVDAVEVRTSGDLTVTLGDTPSLTITAPKSVLDRLTSDIVDGVLVLDVTGPRFGFDLGEIDYVLTVPRLSTVSVQGSSDVTADFSEADDVAVEIDGSGDVEGTGIDASEVTVTISGSGDVTLAGTTDRQAIQVDGSADIDTTDLVSRSTTIDLSGSGDIRVNATETLDVELSGSGDVRYTGGAAVTSDISGSGSVTED